MINRIIPAITIHMHFLVIGLYAFVPPQLRPLHSLRLSNHQSTPLLQHRIKLSSTDDDISSQLAKAKALIEQSKAKIKETEIQQKQGEKEKGTTEGTTKNVTDQISLEAVASTKEREVVEVGGIGQEESFRNDQEEEDEEVMTKNIKSESKPSVVKSKNEETGLITTDGELMATLSEEDEWELRELLDVFQSELEDETDLSKNLSKRDVAASIMNLRLSMHNEDYRKIFDKRNRFIGEDN